MATVSDTTAARHSASPSRFIPCDSRTLMMMTTPTMPTISPATACGRSGWRRKAQPAKATSSGIIEAMIEAAEASTHCIPTQLRPR